MSFGTELYGESLPGLSLGPTSNTTTNAETAADHTPCLAIPLLYITTPKNLVLTMKRATLNGMDDPTTVESREKLDGPTSTWGTNVESRLGLPTTGSFTNLRRDGVTNDKMTIDKLTLRY
jgi:hypothetical protein